VARGVALGGDSAVFYDQDGVDVARRQGGGISEFFIERGLQGIGGRGDLIGRGQTVGLCRRGGGKQGERDLGGGGLQAAAVTGRKFGLGVRGEQPGIGGAGLLIDLGGEQGGGDAAHQSGEELGGGFFGGEFRDEGGGAEIMRGGGGAGVESGGEAGTVGGV